MRGGPPKTAVAVVAATLLAGCGADVLNEELDVSGSWSLVLADADPAALLNLDEDLSGSYEQVILRAGGTAETYPVELARTKGGWYEVTRRWSDGSGVEQSLTGVGAAFGEGLFAVAEPGEGCPLYIFTVGSGALGGRLFLTGDTEGVPVTFTGEGSASPEAPQILPLGSSLSLNALGVDGTGAPYLARYDLVPRGGSILVSQHIAPGAPGEETLFGTGVRVGEHLVLNTAGFLTVFRQRGEDWFGMWVDLKAGALASEILTPDDAKLDVMPFFVGNDFELEKADDGFFIACWVEDGEIYEAAALVFGEKYLALSIPDPAEPWLGVFTVGEG
ncbi:MAG TPA: hypothetical protein ENN88_00145, partial [Candidatus Coatesbacteria bacterium]|nr:hypothetical protein [Candidatus Coatesbacteria bacterium]